MASIETTELKLKTTPTGGVEASHSPYYRRLLSAGYKGFLQGSIGGAGLYGALGVVVGTLIALPAFFLVPPLGVGIFALIPTAGALGLLKGATTFGNIGSVAAINAESAELSEQRRYLLDRYYDLPEGPAGDREAEVIKQELYKRQTDSQKPPSFLHWKTVAIGAAIGAILAFGVMYFAPAVAAGAATPIVGAIESISGILHSAFGLPIPQMAVTAMAKNIGLAGLATMGTAAGALAGATIGIDRYYIRKWFDHTQDFVHSSSHKESALIERSEQVERLKAANRVDQETKGQLNETVALTTATAVKPPPVAHVDQPPTKIQASTATLERRVADLQKLSLEI